MATERVAIVDGTRTAFVKAGTLFRDLTTIDMARHAVVGLLGRTEIDPRLVEDMCMGVVVPPLEGPNLAREVLLRTPALGRNATAHTVSQACISSLQALATIARRIILGEATVAIAGGAESLSRVPFTATQGLASALQGAARARGKMARVKALTRLRPRDLVPQPPALVENFTGLSMGESCEKMAKENGISREEQDRFALESHQKAGVAAKDGRLSADIVPFPVPPHFKETAQADTSIRADTSMQSLASLPPVFDRRYGTLTAGNSSPLTDGASALLVMSASRAHALGYQPLGYLRSMAFAGIDPRGQLLMGPTHAIPRALSRAGVRLADVDVVEMHEAFGAQVVSTLRALASRRYCKDELELDEPVGEIDPTRLNPMGGSIALGHPFGATGARLVMQLLREMGRRQVALGMVSACAAGGLGAAMIFERE